MGQNAIQTNAESLRKSVEETALFSVPNGGWSTCTVNVTYMENYTPVGTKNKFTSRSKSYVLKTAYATKRPTVTVGNIIHYRASGELYKTFKSYTRGALMYDSLKWEYGSLYENSTNKKYSKKTKKYGFLPFVISCSGANMPVRTYSMKMNLNTK